MSEVNLLIRGGYVLTMDSAGDILGGDVHIRDGVIQAIGRNLVAPEAGHHNERSTALDDLASLASQWQAHAADGRVQLGMAWRGTGGSNPAMRVAPELYRAEIAAARELGRPGRGAVKGRFYSLRMNRSIRTSASSSSGSAVA